MYLKIRTNFEYLAKYFFIFIMLADTGFLLLINLSAQNQRMIGGLSVVIAFGFLVYIFMKPSFHEKALLHNRFLIMFLVYNIVAMIIHWIYAMVTYSIPWFNVFMAGHSYFSLIIVPVFLLVFYEWNNSFDKVLMVVAYVGVICACIVIFSGVCIDIGLPVLFKGISFGYRNGHARIAYSSISYFAIFYFGDKILNLQTDKKMKIRYLFYVLLMLGGMVIYVSTRIMIISVACALVGALLLSDIGNRKKIVIIVLGVFLVFAGNVFQTMINSFSLDSDKGASTLARLMALEYYKGLFLEKPFIGIGLVSPIRDDLVSLIYGPIGVFAFTDLGFLGGLYRFGIIGVPVFVAPIIRMAFISTRMLLSKCKYSTLCISVTIFLVVNQISLNYLDFGRNIVSSFYWALLEFIYFKEYYSKKYL
nr:hypothetical protein [uncultured Butyrivibrio sp.]